ncbi:MAG: hypothetical protein V3T83_20025 [Acidobacteriota bacterium]
MRGASGADSGRGAERFAKFHLGRRRRVHIRSLIASVSLSYPIGAVMLLEAGGKEIHSKFSRRSTQVASSYRSTP